ncbi:MAG: ammonium transporter, partial [Cyanobacteria bacterium J06598_3]
MTINFLDVAWLTICGMLVFIMQAGFLCLEAGATRSKNRINVIIKNLTDLGLSVIIFWALGYGLMFGSSWHGVVGINRFLPNLGESQDIWTGSFFLFQAMFCSTAVTILSGATAERIQFKGYLAIAALVSGLIYPVYGHWVWQGIDLGRPGGWLAEKGFVDFAGSTVVHSVGGWCSLAAVLVIGPRLGRFSHKRAFDDMGSTDLPIAFLGTMLLWFGWFGFNGGSNLVFNAQVSNIIANTLIAGAAGVIAPVIVMCLRRRPVEIKPMMNGAIAALVAVTSGCHTVSSLNAFIIGAIGSLLMMAASHALEANKIDDAVGAIPVHLAAGIWGTLAVGLLGDLDRLGTGLTRFEQIKAQAEGILACGLWSFGLSLVALLIFQKLSILRVSHRQEYVGLNVTEHGAKSNVDDVFGVMKYHAKTGNLRRRVTSDSFTEVGRVGQWYNQVITALET